ncbi:MAG: hypothetical protein ACO1N1_09300 [Dyadobacter fermentans]
MEEKQDKNVFDISTFGQHAIDHVMSRDKELGGKDGVLAPLLENLLDAVLCGEAQAHVEAKRPNRRNGIKHKR